MKKTASLDEILSHSEIVELGINESILIELNQELNIFSHFEGIFNENVWTRIFAFLLDSKSKHGKGIDIFNHWIDIVSKERNELSELFINKLSTRAHSIHTKIEWSTEHGRRVDLLIKISDESGSIIGVIGIENKVNSAEQEAQISDYQKSIQSVFPNIPKIILYCTPDGRESKTSIKEYTDCPCLSISYLSFQAICSNFSKDTEGELQLILKSTDRYLKMILAKEKRRILLEKTFDDSLPFNERNKYSPVLPFFNKFEIFLRQNHKLLFKGGFKTFSTNELDVFVEELRSPDNMMVPCYMLHSDKKEPRIGDYFVVRLMIHSKRIHKLKVKDKQPILNDILEKMKIPNSRNEPKHWDPWVNIWTSEKYQLIDMDEQDMRNMLQLLSKSIDTTFTQLKEKYLSSNNSSINKLGTEKMQNQKIIRDALIEKFEGASNSELLEKYKDTFKNVAEMYSQFRNYLYALAKAHPKEILILLKSTDDVVVKSVSRGLDIDNLKRMKIALDVLLGNQYQEVAEKHNISVASARFTFMKVVLEMELGIPEYYGKKQILVEYGERLEKLLKQKIEMLSEKSS